MFTLESFCNAIWQSSYSKVLAQIDKSDYEEFEIPKKNGVRKINYLKKDSTLFPLQNKLLSNFLTKQPTPVCVKGFKKGESYISFLSPHIGAKFFMRIDIESFFPSLSETHIYDELSNIIVCSDDTEKENLLKLISNIVTLDGVLPQGACTSPAMSNIVMARIDQRILKYCQIFDVRYTRYADDMLFSSNSFKFLDKKWFIKKIRYILGSHSLKINYSKLKFGEIEFVLNGYVISPKGIRLSRKRLSDIRHVVSFVRKKHAIYFSSGADVFLSMINTLPLQHRNLTIYPFKSIFQVVQYMCGYRAFLISLVDESFSDTPFQKELQQLIRRIEKQIEALA